MIKQLYAGIHVITYLGSSADKLVLHFTDGSSIELPLRLYQQTYRFNVPNDCSVVVKPPKGAEFTIEREQAIWDLEDRDDLILGERLSGSLRPASSSRNGAVTMYLGGSSIVSAEVANRATVVVNANRATVRDAGVTLKGYTEVLIPYLSGTAVIVETLEGCGVTISIGVFNNGTNSDC